MSKFKPNDEPIRLFASDFLELFTHVSPLVVLIIWLPVVVFFVFSTLSSETDPVYLLPAGLLLGLFFWSFAEYMLHRFIFHFPAKTPWQERLAFLFHGIHHTQPRVKTRLVMPPAVSIPMGLMFFGLFYVIFSVILSSINWLNPVFAGFITGYIFYDMTHYSTHHFPMKKGYFRMVRQQHMHHHFQTPNQRFGVTSPIWDHVFGTMPENHD